MKEEADCSFNHDESSYQSESNDLDMGVTADSKDVIGKANVDLVVKQDSAEGLDHSEIVDQDESGFPDESNLDHSNPVVSNPDENTPDESNPDESNPNESNPDKSNPDESYPDESNPDMSNPDESNDTAEELKDDDENDFDMKDDADQNKVRIHAQQYYKKE